MAEEVEKSGVHITGADSGWPVGNTSVEPPHTKAGDGTDPFPDATAVAAGKITDKGKDEVQKVTVTDATGGTFTLSFGGKTTAGIAYNAPAKVVGEALEALTTIGAGGVTVTGEAGGPYTVTFSGSKFADKNVAQMTADASELEAAEEDEASVTVETTQGGEPL